MSGAVASRRGLPSRGAWIDRVLEYLPALVVLVAAVALWEVATAGPGRRVLPPPSTILRAISEESELLRRAATATFGEALGGLLIGTVGGILVGLATARWVTARQALLPIAVASSAVPLVAIAPVLNNWFGALSPLSKQMMAALLVFFPVTINVTRGLVEVQPAALELMRSYAASEWQVLLKVRLPNMLPFLFTAVKIGTSLAFIGAIVGEYFGGSSTVLGTLVLQSMAGADFPLAWAAILIGSAGAIASYLVIVVAERLVIPWYAALTSSRT
jgi:NitT/TauT family transport system permease protein